MAKSTNTLYLTFNIMFNVCIMFNFNIRFTTAVMCPMCLSQQFYYSAQIKHTDTHTLNV